MSQASQPLAQTVSAQSPSAPTSANSQSSKRVGKGKEILKIPEVEIFENNPSQMIFKLVSSQIILKDKQVLRSKSEYLEKSNFQNILTMEDGFSDKKPSKAVSKFFSKN